MPTKKATPRKKVPRKAPRQKADNPEAISYLVSDREGEFVIELPADWRVTFANVNPASAGMGGGRNEGHCLRVYEAEKLRAVYCNVIGFRDLSIPLARKQKQEVGSAQWSRDSVGNFTESRNGKVDSEFVIEPADHPF